MSYYIEYTSLISDKVSRSEIFPDWETCYAAVRDFNARSIIEREGKSAWIKGVKV